MPKKCDINITHTIELAEKMIMLAQTGYEQHEDSECGVLYSILLDSGYKILKLAQKERLRHIEKDWWNNSINI